MKKITFRADESLIETAREVATAQGKTLDVAFRDWLADYTSRKGSVQQYDALMERLKHINPGGPYNRDEMNER